MRPLDDTQRRRTLLCSVLLCVVPLFLAPLAGRSSLEVAGERAMLDARFSAPSLAATWSAKPVNVARDPFIPEVAKSAVAPRAGAVVGVHVTQGQPIGYAASPNQGPILGVVAIVTGASPRALVDDGSHVRVVGIGDVLDGSRILRIDRAGIHLVNGTVLALAEDEP